MDQSVFLDEVDLEGLVACRLDYLLLLTAVVEFALEVCCRRHGRLDCLLLVEVLLLLVLLLLTHWSGVALDPGSRPCATACTIWPPDALDLVFSGVHVLG